MEQHGLLQVNGSQIVNKNKQAISFAGNSFFWSNDGWGGEKYYNKEVVKWLKKDWGTTIVRASMGVEDNGGYLDNKAGNKAKLKTIVEAAIEEGLYILIDWHSHHAEDNTAEAVAFFKEMAELYGTYDNILYEIYNEPLQVSWSNTIKPYAEEVITAIRAIDPDNIIIVGSPEWSQRVDHVAADPITISDNIAYTLHFYTVWHQQWLRDRASQAIQKGIALFVTEWGSLGYTSNDPETDKWMDWCRENNISHCNWAVNDKLEEWSIVKAGVNTKGNWKDNDLTKAGQLTQSIIREWPTSTFNAILGTEKEIITSLLVYPNPAKNAINISQNGIHKALKYTITNITGQQISTDKINELTSTFTLDISKLQAGFYQLSLETENKKFISKFIKQ